MYIYLVVVIYRVRIIRYAMKKKIGILNFHYSNNNYGAVLQACAIQEVVRSYGYDVENINYIPLEQKKTFKNYLGDILRICGLRKTEARKNVKHNGKFQSFRDKFLSTSSLCQTDVELSDLSLKYTHVLVGSDQVFRPAMTRHNATKYFLDFCPRAIKISYAASFGTDKWENNVYTKDARLFTRLLSGFSAVSVREDSGVTICNEVFEVEAHHVLDPTLLVGADYFREMFKFRSSDSKLKLVSYYKLDIDDDFLQVISRLTVDRKSESKNIYHEKNSQGEEEYHSVEEWLQLISSSDLVVTDSFHCVCFSILFNIDFVCIANPERGIARLSSLLEMLGLSDRLCVKPDLIDSISKKNIDWCVVEQKLSDERKKSINFLSKSLS
ncbi:Polysaccharide pyruvyl transferase [Photobacterium piscicola]|uniref:Polysaccharide pyruvyl transferase n=2 Tax=Photobacterium piscicola TaxID=1378299 RepID=A0A1T5I213_9GAMM|nr:Polysaccharide pyruvyl transferase [Photobacterium piscicola]